MKRLAIVTAAALMFAGMTSVGLAGEEVKNSVQHENSPIASDSAKSVVHTNKDSKPSVMPSNQPAGTTSETKKAAPTSMNEKKSAPVAENKPAATVSDAAKSTVNAVSDQTKAAVTESVKSAVPTPSVPTSPTVAATKPAATPTAPTATPTK
jgi:hypothetical protein